MNVVTTVVHFLINTQAQPHKKKEGKQERYSQINQTVQLFRAFPKTAVLKFFFSIFNVSKLLEENEAKEAKEYKRNV